MHKCPLVVVGIWKNCSFFQSISLCVKEMHLEVQLLNTVPVLLQEICKNMFSMFLVVFVLYAIAICSNVSVSWRCIRSAKAPIHSRIHLHLWQASSYDDTHYAIRAHNVFVLIAERICHQNYIFFSCKTFCPVLRNKIISHIHQHLS